MSLARRVVSLSSRLESSFPLSAVALLETGADSQNQSSQLFQKRCDMTRIVYWVVCMKGFGTCASMDS